MAGAESVEEGEGGEIVDFVQVMKDWRRMCQHMTEEYGNSSCDKCPLGGCSAVYEMCGKENFLNMERDIVAWASENPEPVYPTWISWLINEGVIEKGSTYTKAFYQLQTKPIPADIAQKLGIEPKEG